MNDISAANLFLMGSLTVLVLFLIFKFKDILSCYDKLGTYEVVEIDGNWYVRKYTLFGIQYNSARTYCYWWSESPEINLFCRFDSKELADERLELFKDNSKFNLQ